MANVFSEIYSQVSGCPLKKICHKDTESKEPAPLRRNKAVSILQKTITRPNLLALVEKSTLPTKTVSSDAEGTKDSVSETHSDAEPKPKIFIKKDSSLATVTEESNQSCVDVCDSETGNSKLVNGEQLSPGIDEKPEVILDVSETAVLADKEQSNRDVAESESSPIPEKQKTVSSSSPPDKEPCSLLPNPHIAHLLTQPRDSFEMEEVKFSFRT